MNSRVSTSLQKVTQTYARQCLAEFEVSRLRAFGLSFFSGDIKFKMDTTFMSSRKTLYQGFTLIELIVTVTIAGILMAIAIPSFISTIRNNRLTASANDFVTALNLARSEAIKRGIQVTVRQKGENAQQWESGWDVFVDFDGSNTFADTNSTPCETNANGSPKEDCLLKTYDALPSGFTLRTVDNPATTYQNYAAFLPSGLSASQDVGTFILCSSSGTSGMPQRTIRINATGRPRTEVTTGTCP